MSPTAALATADADIPATAPIRPVHPLFHAGKWLLGDLISTLAFVGLYAISHSIYVATGVAVSVGIGQIVYLKSRGRPVEAMQWLSLGLVVVFGAATLFTRDPRFIMVKPTLIYTAVAAVMCQPGWMNRYLTPIAVQRAGDVCFVFGYIWAGLMFATGIANLLLGLYASPAVWAAFLAVFPLASKFVMVGVQYGTTKFIILRRMKQA